MKTSKEKGHRLEQLSSFELKDSLLSLTAKHQRVSLHTLLNTGQANPNWVATFPREAFFRLGLFAMQECRRVWDGECGIAGIPEKKGISRRFEKFMKDIRILSGSELLWETYRYGLDQHGFEPDEWVYELTCGVTGNQYPFPVRMLKHAERVVHDYLTQELCQRRVYYTRMFDLFATEGGTVAVCYIFDSLMANGLLQKGDTIALGVPLFTPYMEIPGMERYQLNVLQIHGSERDMNGNATFQYPESELNKLKDPSVKCFLLCNPSNPTSVAMDKMSLHYLGELVKRYNPGLMLVTDDTYSTFVPAFHSVMRELPANTLCVYSFSKYFGATGWRLGVIALHKENIFDRKLAALPMAEQKRINKRYAGLVSDPAGLKFIDRLAVESRQVVFGHTAGLSLPQQVQMVFFAVFALIDKENRYKRTCMSLVRTRYNLFREGLCLPVVPDPNRAAYSAEFDVLEWALRYHGKAFVDYLVSHCEPADIVLRLAREQGVVLLTDEASGGSGWSMQVSMVYLDNADYLAVGKALLVVLADYVAMWKKGH